MQGQTDEQLLKKPIKEMSPDELRDYNADAQQKVRDQKKSRTDSRNQQPRSKAESSKKDALAILADRGISNTHVQETLYDLAEQAAQNHKLPVNDHLLRHGLHATLAALNG